ncbi:peptidylprolyl isomerase [Kordiimonas lipolytica]|uniref:Peptidyl-prolyl cis-trans isomerase n=1 Tax=Kordiimonas lipolytica TaxID=1662421 RepID=A0ABV8UBD0_9PROT|nr:peptidylprolyl isomerase [Kordiimonas lipolytica]
MNDSNAMELDKENTLYLDLETGRVVIAMRPDKAPKHVERIKQLVRDGFYDGLVFHRVIEGFMAQGGDPLGTGVGGSGQNIPAEFNDLPHLRGTVSMARAASPDSADSQFFICFNRSAFLDGEYTAWGRVVAGMEHVDMLNRGEPPANPSKIVRMQVAADVEE